jgi:hypothetical protein
MRRRRSGLHPSLRQQTDDAVEAVQLAARKESARVNAPDLRGVMAQRSALQTVAYLQLPDDTNASS